MQFFVQRVEPAGFGSQFDLMPVVTDTARIADLGSNGGTSQYPLVPRQVHFKPASSAKSPDLAGRPGLGQCRQQVENPDFGFRVSDFHLLALKQQFGNAGGGAEIAVNLEGSAQVKEIRQRPLLEQAGQLPMGKITVANARPKRDAPRITPAGAAVLAP